MPKKSEDKNTKDGKTTNRRKKSSKYVLVDPSEKAEVPMDALEQLRQEILRIRREVRFDKYPPKMTIDEDGDVIFEIPEKFYENKTAETEDLTLIGEIKLYDDPFIPITFHFYYGEDED